MVTQRTTAPTRPQAVTALREIAGALSTAWDLDTTLDLIARKTTEIMHVDSCTIYLLDPDETTLRLRATTGLAQRALGRATLKVGEGMTGYAVQSNRPVHASNAQDDPNFKWVEEADERDFRSLLATPLVVEEQPIGALNVQTREVHEFDEAEIEVLSLIGDLAAGALVKARLYDSQRRQIEELQNLALASEAATSPQYLDEILDVVTGMAARMMKAAVCTIFLADESGDYLELRSAKETTNPYRHRPPLKLGEGAIGRVAASGQPLFIRDVRTDPLYVGKELARAEGLVSLLSVPLTVRDRVIGVFSCYTAQEHEFGEEQQALFRTLANQTALAIENAALVSNAAVVREMHHRIKNNLQMIAMLMQLELAEASPQARGLLETSINRVHSISAVHEVLSERGFRMVDVKDVLARVTRMTAETMTAPEQSIAVSVEGEAVVLPSRQATNLALVINELVQNALEHAYPEQGSGRMRISLGLAPKEIVVLVSDDGTGLPAGYERGLGLEIVETLVRDELRGTIKLPVGEPRALGQPGTEVTIRFPRPELSEAEEGQGAE